MFFKDRSQFSKIFVDQSKIRTVVLLDEVIDEDIGDEKAEIGDLVEDGEAKADGADERGEIEAEEKTEV